MVGKRTHHAWLIALYLFSCHRGHSQFVQVEMWQLNVDDIPGLGVQLLAPRLVEGLFSFFHQLVVARIVPARQAPRIVALGVQIALEKTIWVETVTVALYMAVKLAFI